MCGVKSCVCFLISLSIVSVYLLSYKDIRHRIKEEIWKAKYDAGIVPDPAFPIDGGWGPWSPWSDCHGVCDDIGYRKRYRICNSPLPTEDGMPCDGHAEDVDSCYLRNCSIDDFREIVRGDLFRSEEFRQLQAVPALMERCLHVECPFEAIEAAIESDNSWNLDTEVLWNALQCVKHNLGCPVIGEWGAWGSWSTCGARCGRGLRWRLRRCDSPPPSNFLMVCTSTPLESEECEGTQCAIDVLNVHSTSKASWSDWANWTECSESCGYGVRRRRRICDETIQTGVITWGTHCLGSYDEIEVCKPTSCVMDGGWSGWGPWGPCSQTCGVGKRARTRSCTKPVPTRNGFPCIGPRTEVGTCYQTPCVAHTHAVAMLNGDSTLQYNFDNKRSVLFHCYVRFMTLSPHGTILRRGEDSNPQVKLSLQKERLCLDATGSSLDCPLPKICSSLPLEPSAWHTALVTITNDVATLRVDDAPNPIRGIFPCDPELLDEKMNILVGDKFRGAIQELALNFIPLNMNLNRDQSKQCHYCPTAASNIIYEKAGLDEGYLTLENDKFLRIPCFDSQKDWRLELTIKPKRDSGTILFLRNEVDGNWLHLGLQNMRLKLKVKFEDFRSESSSSSDCFPGEWLDVALIKNKDSNTIEASVNSDERIHVVLEEDEVVDNISSEYTNNKYTFKDDTINEKRYADKEELYHNKYETVIPFFICNDEFFVGAIPEDLNKYNISDEITSFSGTIASMSINNVLLDLHGLNVERYKDGEIQVSSRTASVSGSYHETAWGKSNTLNLTCIHARSATSPQKAHWLFLDTDIKGNVKGKTVRSVDDGKVLRLVARADNNLKGFYTCRATNNKKTTNIITFGVLGKIKFNPSGTDTVTAFVVVSTFALILGTISWLIIEGFNDLRNGFGFYRDGHLSPEEEAEAVCRYIDDHLHLYSSESAANVAKEIARSKGRRLASRANFGAQEPQGMEQFQDVLISDNSSNDLNELPSLPPIKSNTEAPDIRNHEVSHEIYKCEPCYISSPRHGSNLTSPRTKLSSSSSHNISNMSSPKVLCSRLLLAKHIYSSKECLKSRIKFPKSRHFESPRKIRSNLLTIKSSSCMEMSPAQKILMRFKQLKTDD